jgi:peptidoglycan hydrolase-like protein with peptidoglycan-binding domain
MAGPNPPASQTIVFTSIPRGIQLPGETVQISVLVTPRLSGPNFLGAYPDWLQWTRNVQLHGLELTFQINGQEITRSVPVGALEPRLWEAVFKQDTLVNSYAYKDYSERFVSSYSQRDALTALKSIYQAAAVELALPNTHGQEEHYVNRRILMGLLEGFQVNWNERAGRAMRDEQFLQQRRRLDDPTLGAHARHAAYDPDLVGADGLPTAPQQDGHGSPESVTRKRQLAQDFSLFHHMPPAPPIKKPDMDTLLDFHQALSALNNYPELQRALGLVFVVDLPADAVPLTGPDTPGALGVTRARPGWDWAVPPEPRQPVFTAYYYSQTEADRRILLTAPRGGSPFKFSDPSLMRSGQVVGLLNLDPADFGLAQVDADGGLHKTILLSETAAGAAAPRHPEVFDPTSTLPTLRSAGLSLFADGRALSLLYGLQQSQKFNQALEQGDLQPRPFFAEDLVRGYRLDIWDSATGKWHSLHLRNGQYRLENEPFLTAGEEGFVKLGATQPAPDPERNPPNDDLYLHEAISRWAGWSLSVPPLGKHLTRDPDPLNAVPKNPGEDGFDPENPPETPFKMTTHYEVVTGSLPRLRFGLRYRMRARVVDLSGSGLPLDDALTDGLSERLSLPPGPDGFAYLRFEPVAHPALVLRDARGVTGPGSAVDRLVIRTYNSDPSKDADLPERAANDRHVAPPRTSVDMGERLGMFDDAASKLIADPAMWDLIRRRDAGNFRLPPQKITVAGKEQDIPVEPDESIDPLPYLPDPLASGAALRDLPGVPSGSLAQLSPGSAAPGSVAYTRLSDPNPRPGSATLIDFGGGGDWQKVRPFRLALDDGNGPPSWNPAKRLLTVYLPKGSSRVVPLTSYISPTNLKLMGIWQWLREYFEALAQNQPEITFLQPGFAVERIAHILQRAVEGGHWMLTPPLLLTLVNAVQQPIGRPVFTALTVQREPLILDPYSGPPLQTERINTSGVGETTALDAVTAWRLPGSLEAFLLGGLRVHRSSTAKLDLLASWDDPLDDPALGPPTTLHSSAHADELPLPEQGEGFLLAAGPTRRPVGYYDADHDLIAFVNRNDRLGSAPGGIVIDENAAPRHHFDDTRHHRVTYTAVATSRFREYFPDDPAHPLDFTRSSDPVTVDVPASARPAAPRVRYVLPTFGWQRQTATSLKRSVRFGGGLRIYLERGWYSSGEGELLGVVLYHAGNGALDREHWKSYITQWGVDPIWQTGWLPPLPSAWNFPEAVSEFGLSLEEHTPPASDGRPGKVDVAGFPVQYDEQHDLRYCDLTINTSVPNYNPFVRLALVRYQPHALPDARLSRVVLADFVQLTPDRSALVTADPFHPRLLRVTISGTAPRGPQPGGDPPFPPSQPVLTPTEIRVTVQERDPAVRSDLGWKDVPEPVATVVVEQSGTVPFQPDLRLWSGTVEFAQLPNLGQYRLLIREYEYISANYTLNTGGGEALPITRRQPGRLIYAEIIPLDEALIQAPPPPASGEGSPAQPDPQALPEPSDPAGDPFAGPEQPAALDYGQLPDLDFMNNPQAVDGHVKLAQAMLNAAGALPNSLQPLAVDGNFGPETQSAVENLQAGWLMPVTGVIDQATWYRLALMAPFPQLEPAPNDPPMQGPPVAVLQQLLNLSGAFPRLAVNGVFDPPTTAALGSFQQARGLVAAPVVDATAWPLLLEVPDDVAPSGSMLVTFAFDPQAAQPVTFVSSQTGDAPALPSDDLDPLEDTAGYWVELHDSNAQPLYRRILDDPFNLQAGFPSDDPDAPLQSQPTQAEPGEFSLLLPVLPQAVSLVIFSSPFDPDQREAAAQPLVFFAIADLLPV